MVDRDQTRYVIFGIKITLYNPHRDGIIYYKEMLNKSILCAYAYKFYSILYMCIYTDRRKWKNRSNKLILLITLIYHRNIFNDATDVAASNWARVCAVFGEIYIFFHVCYGFLGEEIYFFNGISFFFYYLYIM